MRRRESDAFPAVVPVVISLLAAGVAGAGLVSDCVADFVAVPDCGNCGGGSSGIAEGDIVSAGEDFAGAAGSLRVGLASGARRERSEFGGTMIEQKPFVVALLSVAGEEGRNIGNM
jgi:hypothetical protein